MKIGIDASRAFLKNRTGIEEYSYQIVKNLLKELKDQKVVLYVKKAQDAKNKIEKYNNLEIREIKFYRFWTQIGLSLEMLTNPVEVLFVPAHTVPFIHPKNTVVTVHGLEYEHCPESYSLYSRWLHRFFIKKSCSWAKEIIAVSQKTKSDLRRMYKVSKNKISVVYNGFDDKFKITSQNSKINSNYLLYVGRLEVRKNIKGIVEAFEILKEKYNYPGRLILVGKPGHGYADLKLKIKKSKFRNKIIEKGFVNNKEKWELMRGADAFLFPSFCEGFGIPILEAQSIGLPVITSNYGPMDEVAGDESILVNPKSPKMMADLINRIVKDENFRQKVIDNGLENIKRFSWEKSGGEVAELLEKA